MRNGNLPCFNKTSWCQFRSYPTYEEWKQSTSSSSNKQWQKFLSYLWGMETSFLQLLLLVLLLFLSYLWGMETYVFETSVREHFGSYPTYEEWKPSISFFFSIFSAISSYPTYEEWKLGQNLGGLLGCKCSYPTYEEWKHTTSTIGCISFIKVLILPMRNGNNSFGQSFAFGLKLFLSYLWGMETQ